MSVTGAGARAAAEARPGQTSAPRRKDLPASPAHVHLMGVAGAGMRGLAVLLADGGWRVSGCDRDGVGRLPELRAREVTLQDGHDAAHLDGVALLVRSSAVPEDAPELVAAREAGVAILKRARALGALVNGHRLVGVSGTHGKTTITAMTGRVLEAAGLDPTVVVGGEVAAWDGYARSGGDRVAVVEADEFDRSFLELDPALAVVSSVEPEHLDTFGTPEALRAAFAVFARRALDRDGVLCCADDPGSRALGETLRAEDSAGGVWTYGLSADADYRVRTGEAGPDGTRLARLTGPEGALDFLLAMPGDHNLQNAAAALSVALRLGADGRAGAAGLAAFGGVARRLQLLADAGGVAVVDDYAHHPTEVRASLQALRRRWPGRQVAAVFQPHLFTRTRDFAADFAAALEGADRALVLPIFPSRETPILGVTSELLIRAGGPSLHPATREEALEAVREAPAAGPTVFVFMGAGDITDLARLAAEELAGRSAGEGG